MRFGTIDKTTSVEQQPGEIRGTHAKRAFVLFAKGFELVDGLHDFARTRE